MRPCPYQVSRAASLRYFVDGPSISVAGNDIVRFTLVAKGTGSAENVSYEAFRCSTGERTTYAYGKTDRTWREVADRSGRRSRERTRRAMCCSPTTLSARRL